MELATKWRLATLDEVCHIEYGTRVVKKHHSGSKYPVYGGGDKTFSVDSWNRENRVVVSRFGMSPRCTRFVRGRFFLNDSGLTLAPKRCAELLQAFVDIWTLTHNDIIYGLGRGAAQANLDVDAFRELEFAFPADKAEQSAIVSDIEKKWALLAEAESNALRIGSRYSELRIAIASESLSPPLDDTAN